MTSTPASLTSGKQPFRFGLKALLLVTTYAGFVCGWLVWFGIEYWHWYGWFSGWFGILAIVYVVFATYRSRHNQHWAVADILNTTWLITAYNIAVGLLHIFGINSAESFHAYARGFRDCIAQNWVYSTALPLFFTMPAAYLLFTSGRPRTSPATKWLRIVAAIALIDLILCSAAIYLPFNILAHP